MCRYRNNYASRPTVNATHVSREPMIAPKRVLSVIASKTDSVTYVTPRFVVVLSLMLKI